MVGGWGDKLHIARIDQWINGEVRLRWGEEEKKRKKGYERKDLSSTKWPLPSSQASSRSSLGVYIRNTFIQYVFASLPAFSDLSPWLGMVASGRVSIGSRQKGGAGNSINHLLIVALLSLIYRCLAMEG